MSQITLLYNAFELFLAAQLPTYAKLSNAYSVSENSVLDCRKGYGIAVGPADDPRRLVGCKHSTRRSISIELTNQIRHTSNDKVKRKASELSILEDAYKLRKAIETDTTLQATIMKCDWVGDSGITFLELSNEQFYRMTVSFSVEYIEQN